MTDELEPQEFENPEETQDSTLETEVDLNQVLADKAKAEEIAKNQRIRAEKAEQELKALKKTPVKEEKETPKNEDVFTPKDYLALTEHKIGSEDFDEVVRLSKILGKPISETLKDKTTQVILQVRKEERATAEATAITATRQKSGQTLEEKVLSNRSQGRLPETEEESAALAQAEFNKLLKGTK